MNKAPSSIFEGDVPKNYDYKGELPIEESYKHVGVLWLVFLFQSTIYGLYRKFAICILLDNDWIQLEEFILCDQNDMKYTSPSALWLTDSKSDLWGEVLESSWT